MVWHVEKDRTDSFPAGERFPLTGARGRRACLCTRRQPHTRVMASFPMRKLRKTGAVDADGNVVTIPRLPSVTGAHKPPGWNPSLKIVGAGTYFQCSRCYRLVYGLGRENPYDRALRRANNIRMRLGGSPGHDRGCSPIDQRHDQRTYERLQSGVWGAEIAAEETLAMFLERLMRVEYRTNTRRGRRPSKEFWT
jgi:hypothetical protein